MRTAGRCLLGRPLFLLFFWSVEVLRGILWSVGVGERLDLRGLVPTYLPDSVVARARVVLEAWSLLLSSEGLPDVPLFLVVLESCMEMPVCSLEAAVSVSSEGGCCVSFGCVVTVEVSKQLGGLGPRLARPAPVPGTITPHGHTTMLNTFPHSLLFSHGRNAHQLILAQYLDDSHFKP